jgi:glycosyltransferase involved in cell wall biosynthesis
VPARIKVCLLCEGAYPFITGGVSAWVHELLTAVQDSVDVHLFTISPAPNQPLRYTLPANVVGHDDLVLSEPAPAGRPSRRLRSPLMEEVRRLHGPLFAGSAPELEPLLRLLPPGYPLGRDAVDSDVGWEMIHSRNQQKNPAYPFADYFWSWKSAHDMLFTVLGREPPAADLYHSVSTGYAGLAAALAKVRTGRPFLLTEHGLYHKEREMEIRKARFLRGYQRDMWTGIYYNLSRLCYRYADLIIALFEHNRRAQIELGAPEAKTRVIPNGIDVERYTAVSRAPRPGYHVGLVGRVVPIKDIKTFISMAKILSEAIPEAVFHCIGPTDEDPAYFEECNSLVRSLRLEERFHFTGRKDVRECYAFLDVLLLTSVREAQPLVILEAYCAGVPVVSTRVGNVPELLDFDERVLASPKDPEKLAAGVKYLHDHPREAHQLTERCRERVLKFYDRRQLHRAYLELYRTLGAA